VGSIREYLLRSVTAAIYGDCVNVSSYKKIGRIGEGEYGAYILYYIIIYRLKEERYILEGDPYFCGEYF